MLACLWLILALHGRKRSNHFSEDNLSARHTEYCKQLEIKCGVNYSVGRVIQWVGCATQVQNYFVLIYPIVCGSCMALPRNLLCVSCKTYGMVGWLETFLVYQNFHLDFKPSYLLFRLCLRPQLDVRFFFSRFSGCWHP